MKKLVSLAAVIIGLGGYAWWSSTRPTSTPPIATTSPGSESTTIPTTTPPNTTTPPPSATPTPDKTPSAVYKDGTYKGKLANTIYGTIQVSAVISGGKLTDVKYLQYPTERGTTSMLSQKSMPIMKQEALAKQSAAVDNISGATQTVDGFKETLGNALIQAKA